MRDDAMKVPRGRPALSPGTTSTPVNVRLPPGAYDATFQRSRAAGVSVPAVVRRALAKYLDEDDDD